MSMNSLCQKMKKAIESSSYKLESKNIKIQLEDGTMKDAGPFVSTTVPYQKDIENILKLFEEKIGLDAQYFNYVSFNHYSKKEIIVVWPIQWD